MVDYDNNIADNDIISKFLSIFIEYRIPFTCQAYYSWNLS